MKQAEHRSLAHSPLGSPVSLIFFLHVSETALFSVLPISITGYISLVDGETADNSAEWILTYKQAELLETSGLVVDDMSVISKIVYRPIPL